MKKIKKVELEEYKFRYLNDNGITFLDWPRILSFFNDSIQELSEIYLNCKMEQKESYDAFCDRTDIDLEHIHTFSDRNTIQDILDLKNDFKTAKCVSCNKKGHQLIFKFLGSAVINNISGELLMLSELYINGETDFICKEEKCINVWILKQHD